MVEQHTGHRKNKGNCMKTYTMSDSCIAQIVKLIQLGILTGTDISDQLRAFEVVESKSGSLEPSPNFLENFENNIQKMSEEANRIVEQENSSEN